jgi:hypothetical protein
MFLHMAIDGPGLASRIAAAAALRWRQRVAECSATRLPSLSRTIAR